MKRSTRPPPPTSGLSAPNAPFHLFTSLPAGLLERLLSTRTLTARDLTSLYLAALHLSPSLAHAIYSTARALVLAHPYGHTLLSRPLPGETPLAALRFLHLLDPPLPAAQLWSSGRNHCGQGARPDPSDVNALRPCFPLPSDALDFAGPSASIAAVAAGYAHSACITAQGALHVAGGNERGQLGLVDTTSRSAWTPVADLKCMRIAQVVCGDAHTLVLTAGGDVYAAGANDDGQLALHGTHDRSRFEPLRVDARFQTAPVVMLAVGRAHSVLLLEDGTVQAAGDNACGQLGGRRGKGDAQLRPVSCFGSKVVRIACGSDTTMLLTAENMVLVTGKRQCGLSVIGGLGTARVTHLSVGERCAVIRTRQHDVALSVNRKRFRVSDELVDVDARAVAAGVSHYAIVCRDGAVLAAGANAFGQVAAGDMGLTIGGSPNARVIRTHQVSLSRVPLPPGYRALHVAAGAFHTLYLLVPTD